MHAYLVYERIHTKYNCDLHFENVYNIGPQVPYSHQFTFFVIYKWDQKARVFARGKSFQSNLIFANKARFYYSEVPFEGSTLR